MDMKILEESDLGSARECSLGTTRVDVLIVAGNARSLIANRGDLIREMLERGHAVAAAVPRADYLPEVEQLGIPVIPLDMARASLAPWQDLRTLAALWQVMRRLRPRVVLGYTVKPVVYGSLAARLAGVPRAYSLITGLGLAYGEARTRRARLLRTLVSSLYRVGLAGNRAVFFQNPDDQAEFLARGIIPAGLRAVRVDGSGVNLQEYPRCPPAEGPMLFLYVGRLLRDKGVDQFVAAAERLKPAFPEARFVVVGPHDPRLPHACGAAEVAGWHARGLVEFVGGVRDVRPWLARCHVFVFPSTYREGIPRCVLEAMATGRAIVTTDGPGCRETVLPDDNGVLVPPRDVQALAVALRGFLEAPERAARMGAASRRLAAERFDVRRVNRAMLEAMEL
ncbi:glycosyltransferase family 4 protein [Halomonas ventosae]|uniref:Glycosyltransferase involved in cell wall biosynthesis n=1 Tax=Halomonas ventosae TaxID=229007 RepID=A0A2T0VBB0_9GAMM|nr:glycosyltransferase family 4 protein [Halomonas ventosae]PRY67367.1 glycosyltransferase involved in cell wall biosynthesis [Halomonas ventosae]